MDFKILQGCNYIVTSCNTESSCPIVDRMEAKRLVLWLWRMHNAVSLRVLREHPPHGKAQHGSADACVFALIRSQFVGGLRFSYCLQSKKTCGVNVWNESTKVYQ